jgi:hypothetical protein
MKRSPLKRSAKRIKIRGRSRFPKRRNPEFLQAVREMDCLIADRHMCVFWPDRPNVEPAHLKTVGSGGNDVGNVVPLCPRAHDEQEGHTEEFEARYGIVLADEALRIAENLGYA